MRTTENISIAGIAFTIDQEAYEVLVEYIEEIRNVFSADSSMEEIVSDIEERIAELLKEKCISGMVVNVSMVDEVMKRIGNPKELASGEADGFNQDSSPESRVNPEKKNLKTKRLYRDIDERFIGGVCAGLSAFFGIDKVIFRLIFLIVFILGMLEFNDNALIIVSLTAYCCLWIAMPAARTVEQKCEMKGKPISLENFRSKGFNPGREVREVVESPAGRTVRRAGGVFLGLMLLVCGLTGLLSCILIPSLPELISNHMSDSNLMNLPYDEEIMMMEIISGPTFWGLLIAVVGLACIGMLYGGIMLAFDLKSPAWRPGLVIFIAWVISIFVFLAWVIKSVADKLPLINI